MRSTVVPLHPDSDDPQDYSATESELLPVKVFEKSPGCWWWRVDHPAMADYAPIGPFPSAREAYEHLMQYEKLWSSPFDPPDLVADKIAMGAVDATFEGLARK